MGMWAPRAPAVIEAMLERLPGTPIQTEICYYDWWLLSPHDRFDTSEVLNAALPLGRTALVNVSIERTAIHWPYLNYVCFSVTGTAMTFP